MDLSTSAPGRGDPKKGPGRGWYALAILPAICGFAAMVAVLFVQLSKLDDGLEQIVAPGARDLRLEPGQHTVFLEYRSIVNGRVYRTDEVSGLIVRVEAPGGAPVAVTAPLGSAHYSLGGREGEALNAFRIERAGTYRVSADYEGQMGPQTVIAVGRGFLKLLLTTVLIALGAAFLGMILSGGAVIGVYLARRRARQN